MSALLNSANIGLNQTLEASPPKSFDESKGFRLLLIDATQDIFAMPPATSWHEQISAVFAATGKKVSCQWISSPELLTCNAHEENNLHTSTRQADVVLYIAQETSISAIHESLKKWQIPVSLPVIIISQQAATEKIEHLLSLGVHDVIAPDQLTRLAFSIIHAHEEKLHQENHLRTLALLKENEARFTSLTSHLPGMLFHLRQAPFDNYQFLYASEGCQKLFGVTSHDLLTSASRLFEAFDIEERKNLHRALQESARNGALLNWEGRTRGRTRHKWINLRSMPHRLTEEIVEWRGIATNITHSKEGEAQLRKSRQQLAELSSHLEAIKEEERERISRDIHDELGSILVRLKIEVALLASKLPDTAEKLRDKAFSIEGLLDQAMGTASRVARELRPGILKEFGLTAAIECQAEDFTQRFNIPCHVQTNHDMPEPALATSLAIFRIAQEALTNIAKHAHASQVFIRLHREDDNITLEIRDNGRGISEADMQKSKSFGLRGIRERVSSLAGSFFIGGAEHGGTHMTLRIPEYTTKEPIEDEAVQRTLF
ncbi:MAG: histidine kinase [Rhodocyclales bacterium]|nr:histidine kinase [Rhodocyclales bacterium]